MPNVTITPPAIVKVQVGPATPPRVTSIAYASASRNSLHGATDLSLVNVGNNNVIVYNANTDNFYTTSVYNLIEPIDGGTF